MSGASAPENNKGMMDTLTSMPGKIFDGVFGLEDRVDNPYGKKAIAIGLVALVVLAGVGMMFLTVHGFQLSMISSPQAFIHAIQTFPQTFLAKMQVPSPLTYLGIASAGTMMSIGLALLLKQITPKKHHATMHRVLCVALPFFVMFAGAGMIGYAFQASPVYALTSPYLWIGLVLAGPISMYAYSKCAGPALFAHKRTYLQLSDELRKREAALGREMQDMATKKPRTSIVELVD